MSDHLNKKVLLVGAGYMAREYAKVLGAMGCDLTVISRGEQKAREFSEQLGIPVVTGGLERALQGMDELPDYVIAAVGVTSLKDAAITLLNKGISKLLIEKPAGLNSSEHREIEKLAKEKNARVFVAYNRRFYASVNEAVRLIEEEGGVTSFCFEFTEWSHRIKDLPTIGNNGKYWFLANSSHVVDLAFYLGGFPSELSCYQMGGLSWHPAASIYAGAGVSKTGALFSYQANWEAPGRWSVEALTRSSRYIFRPLEKLSVQKLGSVAIEEVPLDDAIDLQYKPGLYEEVKCFLSDQGEKDRRMVSIGDQVRHSEFFERIERA